MQDLLAALISFFLIEPVQKKMADKLDAARAPRAIIAQVAGCAQAATPVVVERATSDPWWAVSTIVQVWTRTAKPDKILAETAPACRPAIEAARPFLAGTGA